RVIRQELAAGRADSETTPKGGAPDPRTLRRASVAVRSSGAVYSLADVLDDTGADAKLVRELEDFGVIKGERRDGDVWYDDTEREVVSAARELGGVGVSGAHLSVHHSAS